MTQVKVSDITEEYARCEGEGDKSLAYWKEAHRQVFERECREDCGIGLTEDMICVCEEFDVVYKEETAVIEVMKPEDYEEILDLWLNTPGMGLNESDDSKEGITACLLYTS